MKYLFRPDELRTGVGPDTSALDYLSCQRIDLHANDLPANRSAVAVHTGPEEVVLVCIDGQFDYNCGDTRGTAVFKDMLYLPWKRTARIWTDQSAVVMRIGAPSDRDTECAHIRFADVDRDPDVHQLFGSAEINSLRDVYMYIDDQFDAARLLVGIGRGRPGGWTVWPPHEHGDEKEELYVYFDMNGGFGVQCTYEEMDNARCFLVREGDMVAVPRGFHPNVGCPGGRIAYVYAMAARVAGERSFMALHFQQEFGDQF